MNRWSSILLRHRAAGWFAAMALTSFAGWAAHAADNATPTATAAAGPARPALTVTLTRPGLQSLPVRQPANGSVTAWQEAVIGAEIHGLRLAEVRADVGDVVQRGQVLAVLSSDTVDVELAQARATLAEARAAVAEARVAAAEARQSADRARSVSGSGVLSEQQITQALAAELSAQAREQATQAREQAAQAAVDFQSLRLRQTRVLSSDDGIVSQRLATPGAVVAQGQELFRLVRQQRLEWRAEVNAADLVRVKSGTRVRVEAPGLPAIEGRVRVAAPTVDAASRNALVLVDLPQAMRQGWRAGMFAQGSFDLGSSRVLTVPMDSVALRDGLSYVLKASPLEGDRARVSRVRIETGRRQGDRIEVLSGLAASDSVVASGAAFLADGDLVRVVAR